MGKPFMGEQLQVFFGSGSTLEVIAASTSCSININADTIDVQKTLGDSVQVSPARCLGISVQMLCLWCLILVILATLMKNCLTALSQVNHLM